MKSKELPAVLPAAAGRQRPLSANARSVVNVGGGLHMMMMVKSDLYGVNVGFETYLAIR